MRAELARYLLVHGRGVRFAVVGDEAPRPMEIVLHADTPLVPSFACGPPGSAVVSVEDDGRTLRLNTSRRAGDIVAGTMPLPDDHPVTATVSTADAPAPREAVRVGRGDPLDFPRSDDSWNLDADGLPDSFGSRPGRVYLWRTAAGPRRRGRDLQQETLGQLGSLGYIR